MILENETLKVELDAKRPIVERYLHKPTGQVFDGGNPDGRLRINGESVPWQRWETKVTSEKGSVSYRMGLPATGICITWRFSLKDTALAIRLAAVEEPGRQLKSIEWEDLPLLVCHDPSYRYWRLFTGPPDSASGHKMWATDTIGAIAELDPETEPRPVIYGALWDNRLCAFVDSNYPLFPVTHQKRTDGGYAISLNTYQYRARTKTLPLLEVTVGFLQDTNRDARADVSDYRLWINRSRPKGDELYYDAVMYKIFMHHAPVNAGVATNLDECEEIIRDIYHITDGLPQIIYLVGQQTGGHDGAYPTLGGGIDPLIGTEQRLRQLSTDWKEKYNAILSYHCNIDDAYRHSNDWDERYVVGSPGDDALNVHGSICHTRDVETGEIFRRLEEFMACFPVEQTLHMDNLRLTNTLHREGWEDIGALEELVCGLMSVIDWLKARGITVTTEGHNGMPIDPACIVSGFWHHDSPDRMRQILHRRICGGGRGSHLGGYTVADYGICNSIHIDISAQKWPPDDLPADVRQKHFGWMTTESLTWTPEHNWKRIVDCLYLGTLLHHFYNEREMLAWDEVGSGWRITYEKPLRPSASLRADDVVAEVCIESPESLKVTMGDVTIADGNDRFIPRANVIYAYSKDGSDRHWTLPQDFRGVNLDIFTLHKDGHGPAPDYTLSGDTLRLRLEAGVPVKITKITSRSIKRARQEGDKINLSKISRGGKGNGTS